MSKLFFEALFFSVLVGVAYFVFNNLKLDMLHAFLRDWLYIIGGGPQHEEALRLIVAIAIATLTDLAIFAGLSLLGIKTGVLWG